MKVLLATIALNEAEFLADSIRQHASWPGLVGWVVVEGATRNYGAANPEAVTAEGLSTDGTAEVLDGAPVIHIRHGWADGPGAQQKRQLRNRYCSVADELDPDVLIVVDADEFYTRETQQRILEVVQQNAGYDGWLFAQRHLWRPASIADQPAEQLEVVGGYWQVPHLRVWRWERGLRYRVNHNHLTYPGRDRHLVRRPRPGDPECIHYGFARDAAHRARTNRYYVARGEGRERVGRNRKVYVDCRAAFETWQPGDTLPHGARVMPYDGPVPEVFRR